MARALRADIEDGHLSGPLASEAELAERFSVSRSVVRQALRTLASEGLITKVRGRGSFINPVSRVHRIAQSLNGLGMQLEDRGQPTRTEVLVHEWARHPSPPREWRDEDCLHLIRLRSLAGQPLALIETYLPAPSGRLIESVDLTDRSLHALLRECGIRLERSQRTVLAVPAREYIAGRLELDIGAPLLVLSGTTFDDTGEAVETFTTHHRGDRVAFDLETSAGDGII